MRARFFIVLLTAVCAFLLGPHCSTREHDLGQPCDPAAGPSGPCCAADRTWHCKTRMPLGAAPRGSWLESVSVREAHAQFSPCGYSNTTICTSWKQTTWAWDIGNSSTCASDTNTCTSTTCAAGSVGPCATFGEVARRWGTYRPRFQQATSLVQLSPDTDNTDPKYLDYISERGTLTTAGGLLSNANKVNAGTLASVVHQTQGGPGTYFNADIGSATGAVGQLIDIVHAGTHFHAWLKANTGGNVWTMSQPIQAITTSALSLDQIHGVGPASAIEEATGAGTGTIVNGDAYTTFTPTAMNIVEHAPMLADYNGASINFPTLQQCTIFDPTSGSDTNERQSVYLGDRGTQIWIDVQSNRAVSASNIAASRVPTSFINPFLRGSAAIAIVGAVSSVARPQFVAFPSIYGGIIGGSKATQLGSVFIGQDTIVSAPAVTIHDGGYSCMAMDSGTQINIAGYVFDDITSSCTGAGHSVVWGGGLLAVGGTGRLVYAGSGTTGQAVNTFLNSGGLNIGGLTVACNGTQTGTSAGANCNIAITAANLDAATGAAGFGGNAWIPGGGSITAFF